MGLWRLSYSTGGVKRPRFSVSNTSVDLVYRKDFVIVLRLHVMVSVSLEDQR